MSILAWEGNIDVGQDFRITNEGVYGKVTDIFYDQDGFPAACVLELADGGYAAVDLSKCSPTDSPLLN